MTVRLRCVALVVRAWCELARFDLFRALSTGSTLRLRRVAPRGRKAADAERTSAVCNAVATAACLYWKPVVCRQRLVSAAPLLRARGVAARLVIGCRAAPLLSHAWVQVDDRLVNESTIYRQLLRDGVSSRLQARGPVVAELSGGPDPSSAVCVAADLTRQGDVAAYGLTAITYVHRASRDVAFIGKAEEQCCVQSVRLSVNDSPLFAESDILGAAPPRPVPTPAIGRRSTASTARKEGT